MLQARDQKLVRFLGITGQLEENVQLARGFTPLSESRMAAIAQKTEPVSKQALFFRFSERT